MTLVPPDFPDSNVCVMGLGYVGLTLAAVMADVGLHIYGVEIRDSVLDLLQKGEPHFHEPGLKERLRKVLENGSLCCSKYIPENCKATVYIITVGTPLGDDGKVRTDMIINVTKEIAQHLREGDLVVMRSTVRIGTTRNIVMPILEQSGVNFELAFCPERTIEGAALSELRRLPQIIGGLTLKASVRASQLFQFLSPTMVRVSDIETAEVIKMIDNAYRDVIFAYANEVARICDAVNVSAIEVVNAGKLGYSRMNLPMPGPVGGPCLEKDPYILVDGVTPFNIEPEITLAARKINERQPEEVISHLANITSEIADWPENPVITLMGLAFKGRPATDDLRGTMAKPILEAARRHFPRAEFRGYDPVVTTKKIMDFGLDPRESIESAIKGANLVMITNNHPVFSKMPIEDIAHLLDRPGLFYDFWNNFSASDLKFPEGVGYIALGSHGKALIPREKSVMSKYLVTGGTGFIGALLIKRLVREGHTVRCLDNNFRGAVSRLGEILEEIEFVEADIRDAEAVHRAAKGMDGIFHLAFINGTEFFYARPNLVLDVGVRGILNVLDSCRVHDIGEFYLASSSEVYQTPTQIPTDETVPLSIPDVLNPRYTYAGAKIISELMAINYGRKEGFERLIIFRPHNVYGPNMGREHVLPEFIERALDAIVQNPSGPVPFPIQGDGTETRAFIYIDDFVDAIMLLLKKGEHFNIYHIGNPEELTIRTVAEKVVAYFGRAATIIPGEMMAGSTPRRCPDIGKIAKMGFKPKINFDAGLPSTAEWYRENRKIDYK